MNIHFCVSESISHEIRNRLVMTNHRHQSRLRIRKVVNSSDLSSLATKTNHYTSCCITPVSVCYIDGSRFQQTSWHSACVSSFLRATRAPDAPSYLVCARWLSVEDEHVSITQMSKHL